GSKVSTLYKIRNTFIIFLVSGFWHGASWNFVFWGGLNALLIMPQVLFKTKKATTSIVAENTLLPSVKEFFQVLGTFILTTFVWIFFRAETLTKAFSYIGGIFKFNDLNPFAHQELGKGCAICFMLIIPFMLVEWVGRRNNYAIERFGLTWSKPLRWSFYALLIFVVGMYMNLGGSEFIYFQF
ncbi:MAG: MBOAT family protein, partial [Sphingobacteriaceae bacterium]